MAACAVNPSSSPSQLSGSDPTAERTIHTLRSSNLPFYTAVWDAAKSSAGLVTFKKRFSWTSPPPANSKAAQTPRKQSVLVDIVAQGGFQWVKVSTITETRLLFDLAKAGWEAADSSDSDASGEYEDDAIVNSASSTPTSVAAPAGPSPPSNSHQIELVRLAVDLRCASRANLLRYRRPSIRFVLPKILTHPSPAIASILSHIRATGATVECGFSCAPEPSSDENSLPFSLSSVFHRLIPDPHSSLTPTVNIDCTILLALISDLSHSSHTPHSPTHHQAITQQISVEVNDPLLPASLYPALEGRDLVCTAEAAQRMREIVQQLGTETECKRASLILGHDVNDGDIYHPSLTDPSTIRTLLAAQSEYEIPPSLRLPIRVIPTRIDMDRLPAIAHAVAAELTPINQSVFLWGWEAGMTTVSSNRTVAKLIEGIIGEENERQEGEDHHIIQGPEIWLCSTARSLMGKGKGTKGG